MLLIRSARPLAALCATLALTWSTCATAAPPPKREEAPVRAIAIVVNGEELPRDPAPRIVNGRLLVPVIRIYGALGIGISRDGETIVASAPGKRIAIAIGSDRAQIDTRPVVMDAPARTIDGATYVPLRFVADSLGAQVSYNPKARQVEVISTIVGRTPGLEQHLPSGSTQLVGDVSAVDLTSSPASISVVRGPSVRTIALTSEVRVVVQDVVTRTEAPGSLDDVHVGDAVSVVLRPDGRVARIVARYASRAGTIAAVSPSQFVLRNGYVVTPDKTTQVTLNGNSAQTGDLKVGDSVTVRLNPDTGEKRQIIASRELPSTPQPSGAVQITQVTVDARRPLKSGDVLSVTLTGTPGGRASFDIGTYVNAVPMTERAPGIYTARYVVPPDVNFSRSTVYGNLRVGSATAPRAQAQTLVAVATTPPQIVDIAPTNGATVNNARPSIYATYRTPTDAGINPSTARIQVNGLDVTPVSTRTDGFITYTPAPTLPDGTVRVVVSVEDNAGNKQSRAWTFTIRSH
jgi:hypothetical protein